MRLRDLARDGEEQGESVFRGRDGVATGRVHDDDASFGRGVGIDVFVAHSRAPDHFEFFRRFDQFRGNFGAASNNPAVVVTADFFKLIRFEAELNVDFESRGILKYR